MARPRAEPEQQVRAYQLYKGSFKPKAILLQLEREYESPVSTRTVERWVAGFKKMLAEVTSPDVPFEWHRLEEYGLPWEASAYLLEMWAWADEFWDDVAMEFTLSPSRRWRGLPMPAPTVRQVRWWWRVHLAVPEAENKLDVYFWAEAFVKEELRQLVGGKPPNFPELEAYLAYKPWEDKKKLQAYLQAVEDERIPWLGIVWMEIPAAMLTKSAIGPNGLELDPLPLRLKRGGLWDRRLEPVLFIILLTPEVLPSWTFERALPLMTMAPGMTMEPEKKWVFIPEERKFIPLAEALRKQRKKDNPKADNKLGTRRVNDER